MNELAIPLKKINIQKIVFFLREVGIPVQYKYEPYLFGPYSSELKSDLWDMEICGAISLSDSMYKLETDVKNDIDGTVSEKINTKIKEYMDALNKDYSFDNMEISGTIIYCAKALDKVGITPNKDNVVQEFKNWKGSKYQNQIIEYMYDRIFPVLH